ncbi:MAG: tetratricopeptide repeat protein [Deltaproteobacteria bacterium]|nr:tetratricopeptide repeat protein [Deltaproteobacteria bacterium]
MSPRSIFSSLSLALAVAAAACGGPDKPPVTPDHDAPPPLDTPPAATSKPGATDGPVATSTSDDVTKGTAAIKAGDWTGARAAFESAIKKNAKQADAHYYLGLVMDKTGDKAAAEKSYRTALELQPDLQEASENLTAILVESKKYDDAIAVARKALAKNAKNSEMALNLAIALSEKGDADGATKAFEDAVKLAPNDVRFFVAYGHHLVAVAKKQPEGIAQLKKAQSVAGEDAGAVAAVGFEMRLARAVPECIAAFDKAISIKDVADFRTNRALCKLANKDRAGAIADLQAATQKEPAFAVSHYWLGLLLHEDGKFPEAATEYEAYLKNAPDGPMSKMAEAKLKMAKEKKKPEKPAPPKK